MIIIYTWMIFFTEDVPFTANIPYARDRFIETENDTKRMKINREAQNIGRDARFYSPRQ